MRLQGATLTDPDSRSMATSGRGSGVVGYNVQVAVDTEHHLIVTHEVTNSGSDRAQLASIAKQAKAVLQSETLDAVADRGYFNSPEILACHEAGITVTLPKPMTSGAKSEGRFGKQDFVYLADQDVYRCPAGERLTYRYTNEEDGKMLRRYWTTACPDCPLKPQCTKGPERRITRWEHEHVLEAVQQRLDANPEAPFLSVSSLAAHLLDRGSETCRPTARERVHQKRTSSLVVLDYGRALGICSVGGTELNSAMVGQGWALALQNILVAS